VQFEFPAQRIAAARSGLVAGIIVHGAIADVDAIGGSSRLRDERSARHPSQ
jgi:hypothetical protein